MPRLVCGLARCASVTEPALVLNVPFRPPAEEINMGHAVHIHSREQYIQGANVLDKVGGTWQGIGPSSDPVLLLTESQYNALLAAGVISANDKEVQGRGKKAAKKTKS
jgi:hypothetical protein